MLVSTYSCMYVCVSVLATIGFMLTFSDILILGCSRNTFGFNCSMVCNCMNGGQCNSTTGCECSSRWTGGNCTIGKFS